MRLVKPFVRLPLRFDAERLAAEMASQPAERWRRHPQDFAGNSFLPLIASANGDMDSFAPPMALTPSLGEMPYTRQALASFEAVLGRTRLMRLAPRCGVPPHVDIQYYWRRRVRVHIPIATTQDVRFHCGDEDVHMAPGEAWIFDNWRQHEVKHPSDTTRTHLVFDTVGSSTFWALVKQGQGAASRDIPFTEGGFDKLALEQAPPKLMLDAMEVEAECMALAQDIAARAEGPHAERLISALESFHQDWSAILAMDGDSDLGRLRLLDLVTQMQSIVSGPAGDAKLSSNGATCRDVVRSFLTAALTPEARQTLRRQMPRPGGASGEHRRADCTDDRKTPSYDRPIFIVAAPRSGSTALFDALAAHEALFTLGGEAHQQIESIRAFHPMAKAFASNALDATDADPDAVDRLLENFAHDLRTSGGARWSALRPELRMRAVRLLEKTPKNILRIPFFAEIFNDALFVFLHRRPEGNISSIVDAWESGRFVTYPRLPGWSGPPWSLLLTPGWREWQGMPIAQIAALQWEAANRAALSALAALPRQNWISVSYEDFVVDRGMTIERIRQFADLPFSQQLRQAIHGPQRLSRHTLTPPDAEKWRKNEARLAPYLPRARAFYENIEALNPSAPTLAAELAP